MEKLNWVKKSMLFFESKEFAILNDVLSEKAQRSGKMVCTYCKKPITKEQFYCIKGPRTTDYSSFELFLRAYISTTEWEFSHNECDSIAKKIIERSKKRKS